MNPIFLLTLSLRTIASSGASITCPNEGGNCSTGLPVVKAGSSEVHQALAILFGIAAVISVLMIIIGGLAFLTSGGAADKTAKARETIIFAAVGLAVSISAEAVVAFVLGKL